MPPNHAETRAASLTTVLQLVSADMGATLIPESAVQTECVRPTQPNLPATQGSGVTLNPPHGQPGHRCDIAVGAPLPNDGNVVAQAQSQVHSVSQGEAMPVVSGGMPQQVAQVQQPQAQQSYVGPKGEKLNRSEERR